MGKQRKENSIIGKGIHFTPRELDVLPLVAEGLLNKEIAGKLTLSERRVEEILSSIYRKLDVSTRKEVIAIYVKAQIQESLRAQEDRIKQRVVQDRRHFMVGMKKELDKQEQPSGVKMVSALKKPETLVSHLRILWKNIVLRLSKDLQSEHLQMQRELYSNHIRLQKKEGVHVNIDPKGFTSDEYATLVVLKKLELLNEDILTCLGLSSRVVLAHQIFEGISPFEHLYVMCKPYNIVKEGFTEAEYINLTVWNFNGHDQQVLSSFDFADKIEFVDDGKRVSIVSKKPPEGQNHRSYWEARLHSKIIARYGRVKTLNSDL